MITFRDFLETNAGILRYHQQVSPNVPHTALKDIVHTNNANYHRAKGKDFSDGKVHLPDLSYLNRYQWNKKPQIISVAPNNFSSGTLDAMVNRRFGFSSNKKIWKDTERYGKIRKEIKPNKI